MNNRNEQQGFVLLFAIVVSAVIFFIGAGIFSIAYKELIISSLGKDSQKSIFMADSAIECALQAYRDGKFYDNLASVGNFPCFGELVSIDGVDASTTSLAFRLSLDDACARVSVSSQEENMFVFFAQGYNKCSGVFPVENFPGLTERVYKVEVAR